MPKCLFVLSSQDHEELRLLSENQGKSMSELVREGIGLLKLRYAPPQAIYNAKNAVYNAQKLVESAKNGT